MKDDFLDGKLNERKSKGSLRQLKIVDNLVDFCSNDYLGLSSLLDNEGVSPVHGSTGSRLLAGNYRLIEEVEADIATFHQASTGLIFNSGYDANLGILSSVPQKDDTILYDYLSHASIRDGIRLSFAQSFSFRHNDIEDLQKKIQSARGRVFVVTESVFSMDGDVAPLVRISEICEQSGAALIVDEAHATGVIGARGEGLVQQLGLQEKCFARIHTFGKALGCHGAIILGSEKLRDYLINFARSFLYTTALPPSTLSIIRKAYRMMERMQEARTQLRDLISLFQSTPIRFEKLASDTAIQAVIVPGNDAVKELAAEIQRRGFDVRPILYPTVPLGRERLRIVLHSFNTNDQVVDLLSILR